MKDLVKQVAQTVNTTTTAVPKADAKVVAYEPITKLVAEIKKDKPALFVGKWKANVVGFEGDQRCETIALVASCIENNIIFEGPLLKKIDEIGQEALHKMVTSSFWGKWYKLHLARFNKFFKEGTADKYTKSVIFYLKEAKHTFRHYK